MNDNAITEQTNFYQEQQDISNKDLTEIVSFLIGRDVTNGNQALLAYKILSQTLILTPRYTVNTKPMTYNPTTKMKSIPMCLTIEAPVFDGVNTVDYGSLFYRNGFGILVNNNDASIKFNRLTGMETTDK